MVVANVVWDDGSEFNRGRIASRSSRTRMSAQGLTLSLRQLSITKPYVLQDGCEDPLVRPLTLKGSFPALTDTSKLSAVAPPPQEGNDER